MLADACDGVIERCQELLLFIGRFAVFEVGLECFEELVRRVGPCARFFELAGSLAEVPDDLRELGCLF